MHSRQSHFPDRFTARHRKFVLIPAVVVAALAAPLAASAAASPIPIVTTGLVYNVESGSAVVGGTVNSNAEAATYRFDYGTSTNYTSQTISEPILNTAPDLVDAAVTGLSPNTLYHYRIEATDAWGTSYGADETFTTAAGTPPPAVATGSASGIGANSATVAGTVNPNGTATTYQFDYGTSTSYTSQAPAPPDPSAGSGTTAQTESITLTDLSPNTVYHYRIEATNTSGTSYGADQTFTTATSGSPSLTASFTARAIVIHNRCGFIGMFNASASVAPAWAPITQYAWNFGNGTSIVTTSPDIGESYNAGSYLVVLTVTDADGATAKTSRAISGMSGSMGCI
jgi:phosphodiesterase/alkaline phosphatase D-like protein